MIASKESIALMQSPWPGPLFRGLYPWLCTAVVPQGCWRIIMMLSYNIMYYSFSYYYNPGLGELWPGAAKLPLSGDLGTFVLPELREANLMSMPNRVDFDVIFEYDCMMTSCETCRQQSCSSASKTDSPRYNICGRRGFLF